MRAEPALLRIGEYLVRRACHRLPPETRGERYREWAAELPAILHDREIRLAPYRAVRMLGYAADTLRGTARASGRAGVGLRRPRASCPACCSWPPWEVWSLKSGTWCGIRDTG